MTCFFRDMTLGRNTTSSASSTLKAWRMLSLVAHEQQLGALQQHIGNHQDHHVEALLLLQGQLMSCKNSPLRWSSWSESMQVTWLTARLWPAMWNSL